MFCPRPDVVVVQETHGNWSGLLRRQLMTDEVTVTRVETLEALDKQLQMAKRGCFTIQFDDASALDSINWLIDARTRYSDACFCGISSRVGPDDWVLYEAGVSLVVRHPLAVPSLARLVRRYFAIRCASSRPAGTEITTEAVWLSLPWCDRSAPTFET